MKAKKKATRVQADQPRREKPLLVGLRADERKELERGARAMGETVTETLRQGGLVRARRAVLR